jgi:hypothetical protein
LVGTTGVCADPAYANSMTYRDQTPRKSQKSRPVGEVGLWWRCIGHCHAWRFTEWLKSKRETASDEIVRWTAGT